MWVALFVSCLNLRLIRFVNCCFEFCCVGCFVWFFVGFGFSFLVLVSLFTYLSWVCIVIAGCLLRCGFACWFALLIVYAWLVELVVCWCFVVDCWQLCCLD